VRALDRLEQLYAIGAGPGANRIGYSPEEDEAHELARRWLEEAGLEVEVDPAGNLFGQAAGPVTGAGRVWTGSHLDSVPQGGRFDGALGVVAAIEAVERAGLGTVVVFRAEEVGCLGSWARVERAAISRPRSSRCTSSRALGWPRQVRRSGSSRASSGTPEARSLSRAVRAMPGRRRWRGGTMRS
jgi:hypothetical protein